MHLKKVVLLLCSLALGAALRAQVPGGAYLDVAASGTQSSEEMQAALRKQGFGAGQAVRDGSVRAHLRMGPYNAAEAETVRKALVAQGYSVKPMPAVPGGEESSEASERMRRLEAEANARLLGTAVAVTPATAAVPARVETRTIDGPGGSSTPLPGTPMDQEAAAFAAIQANTERAKAADERQREARAMVDQQREADRLQREAEQASAPPQQSTAAAILNGISGAIQQATAAQAQSQDSINEALQQQQAKLGALQQQMAANQAAEQQRRAAAAVAAQQARQVSPVQETQPAQRATPPGLQARAVVSSGPVPRTTTPSSFSTRDQNGAVSLGSGSPRACAVSNSGSQLPLVPGTAAQTCNPASCRGLGYSMHFESRWTDETKSKVVGFFTNNSMSDATCTWAFHRHGVWTDQGQAVVKLGAKNQGGSFGGVWSVETDSSTIQYVCFEGIDPVDEHGKPCNANIHFEGMTVAGTDK